MPFTCMPVEALHQKTFTVEKEVDDADAGAAALVEIRRRLGRPDGTEAIRAVDTLAATVWIPVAGLPLPTSAITAPASGDRKRPTLPLMPAGTHCAPHGAQQLRTSTPNGPFAGLGHALGLLALDEVAEGVMVTDQSLPDNPIIYANASFARMTGYGPGETLGRNCRFLQGEDLAQPEITLMRDAIATRSTITVTLRNYRRDGSLFWNEVRLVPLGNGAHGPSVHYVAFQHDVTSRIEAEAELRKAKDRAEQAETLLRDAVDSMSEGFPAWCCATRPFDSSTPRPLKSCFPARISRTLPARWLPGEGLRMRRGARRNGLPSDSCSGGKPREPANSAWPMGPGFSSPTD
jgi:PAS domain S-box-containing protein